MEEYFREHRKRFGISFSGACSSSIPKSAGKETPPETSNRSLSSSFSSITSQEVGDFISEFRNAYYGLRIRKGNGLLTKEDLGEVLFLLDQEPTEELLGELFNEIDKERKGIVEVEHFLEVLDKRLNPSLHRAPTPKSYSPLPSSSAACLGSCAEMAVAAPSDTSADATSSSSSNGPRNGSVSSHTVSPPPSGHGKRSLSTSPGGKPGAETSKVNLGASSSRKHVRSQPLVLWWGFQDLADTL